MSGNLVLFDMDGTLTKARCLMDAEKIIPAIISLSEYADVGIVTGSGMNYVMQQCSKLVKHPELIGKLHVLPCNGTYYFDTCKNCPHGLCLQHENDMVSHMGNEQYENIVRILLTMQSEIANKYPIPLTGMFIDFRKSMINWSPSGRSSKKEQREKFVELDKKYGIRKAYLSELLKKVSGEVVAALGGETSIDIYPKGWDKTYALQHFKEKTIYFVGDKCTGDGNDKTICEAVSTNCFPTSGPDETVKIITEKLIPLLSQK